MLTLSISHPVRNPEPEKISEPEIQKEKVDEIFEKVEKLVPTSFDCKNSPSEKNIRHVSGSGTRPVLCREIPVFRDFRLSLIAHQKK